MKNSPRNAASSTPRTRREFLSKVGQGMLAATVGFEVANGLGLSSVLAEETSNALNFGSHEPLVRLMQDTPADKLLPMLAEKLRGGMEIRTLVTAQAPCHRRSKLPRNNRCAMPRLLVVTARSILFIPASLMTA